jgi:hypothetical protein
MLLPRLHSFSIGALIIALVTGIALLAYARWASPLLAADRALGDGNPRAALELYAVAEARFRRFRLAQQVFSADYARAVYNQLALLFEAGEYDMVLAKAEIAPPAARPRFWAGSASFARAMGESKPEERLAWLTRAADELRQALAADPDDWDTKYNYEVVARLAAELRKEPKKKPDSLMQLLRPQPQQGRPVRKVG